MTPAARLWRLAALFAIGNAAIVTGAMLLSSASGGFDGPLREFMARCGIA